MFDSTELLSLFKKSQHRIFYHIVLSLHCPPATHQEVGYAIAARGASKFLELKCMNLIARV